MQQPTTSAPQAPGNSGSPTSDLCSLGWGDRSSSSGWEPSPASPSFAGLLAALAAPAQTSETPGEGSSSTCWTPAPSWNDDDLADDVATLSYESALKAHARYRPSQVPSHVSDQSLLQPAESEPFSYEGASAAASAPCPILSAPVAEWVGNQASLGATANQMPRETPEQVPGFLRTAHFERNLKEASITIRMSKAECVQLHRRAAEAGLTVSAYLRSCTFEAETLRTMVKDTLAQLRSVAAQAKPAPSAPTLRSRFRKLAAWLARLITPWNGSQRVARA